MHSTPLLSIIIPVYNSQNYIKKCLDSLIKQEISTEIYEIILVNDCSTDNSKQIILEYKNKYSNIIYLEHDVNKRQGAARNTGIKHAKGQYIMFIDSDDYIDENSLSELFKNLDNKNELIFISVKEFNENGEVKIISQKKMFSGIKDGVFIIKNDINFRVEPFFHIIKRDLLIKNDIQFEEKVQLEDVDFSVRSVLCAKKAICSNYKGYNYRYNTNSTVRQKLKIQLLQDGIKLAYRIKNIANQNKHDDYIYNKYNNLATNILNNDIKLSIFLENKERIKFKDFVNDNQRNDIRINLINQLYLKLMKYINPYISILTKVHSKISKINK